MIIKDFYKYQFKDYSKYNMKADFIIRAAQQSDTAELRDLFRNTVLMINSRDYSQAEVEDWASCGDDLSRIEDMIKTHYFIVAVNQCSQIVGFSSITPQGYLHSMFVHKDFQGKGIATMLLEEIERYAITAGIMRITSEVSLTARPFFEKRGYIVEEEQKRKANQLSLTNFWMAKGIAKCFKSPAIG
jgi:putative acetyltransferase